MSNIEVYFDAQGVGHVAVDGAKLDFEEVLVHVKKGKCPVVTVTLTPTLKLKGKAEVKTETKPVPVVAKPEVAVVTASRGNVETRGFASVLPASGKHLE